MLKLNHWYEDVKKEDLLIIMKKYPFFPFLVDGEQATYYRWNPEKQILETDVNLPNDEWISSQFDVEFDDNHEEIETVSYCIYPHMVIKLLSEDNDWLNVNNFDFELESHL